MKRFFITGTDTDCGKTFATTKLLEYFPNAKAIKPVASGCLEINKQLVSEDALRIQALSTMSMDEINPWRFKSAIAPHLAAQEQNLTLSAKEIAQYCLNIKLEREQLLFIEGAGGLMVPLNAHETWVDFLKCSRIPVLLIVGMKLGCINHALLTASVLAQNNIPCVGWIANCLQPDMAALSENIDTLRDRLECPLLTTIAYGGVIGGDLVL